LGPCALGLDIESVRPDHPIDDLIELACHRDERQHLASLPQAQRHLAFHRLWTRKEAYCKAIGSGLQMALDTLSFSRASSEDGLRVLDTGTPQDGWIVTDIAAPAGCVASLCRLDSAVGVRLHPPAARRGSAFFGSTAGNVPFQIPDTNQ
jgi:4'-phosphopantetheinyl transferase